MPRGRPKGSKNKPKIITPSLENQKILLDEQKEQGEIVKRKRGRPRKTDIITEKPNADQPVFIERSLKDLKSELRSIRKLKKQCRSGTKERIDLHRKMQALKKQISEIKSVQKSLPEQQEDTNKYQVRYYTGFMTQKTRENFKKEFGIEWRKKEIL